MVAAGIHVRGGSDAPVIHPDPINDIYFACNHPYDDTQSLSIHEALKLYTSEIAWTSFDEEGRGSLEEKKVADMVLLNKNPLDLRREELRDLRVEALYLSGKPYKPGMSFAGMLFHSLTSGGIKI